MNILTCAQLKLDDSNLVDGFKTVSRDLWSERNKDLGTRLSKINGGFFHNPRSGRNDSDGICGVY
jgi:hypothetical protein